jgi:hypothetical protein
MWHFVFWSVDHPFKQAGVWYMKGVYIGKGSRMGECRDGACGGKGFESSWTDYS